MARPSRRPSRSGACPSRSSVRRSRPVRSTWNASHERASSALHASLGYAAREERDALLETVRQMEEALAPPYVLPTHRWLTRMEERVLRAIRSTSPHIVHRERAIVAVYALSDVAPRKKTPDVYMT